MTQWLMRRLRNAAVRPGTRFVTSSPCNAPKAVVTLRATDVKDPHKTFDSLVDHILVELGGTAHGWVVFGHGLRHLPGKKRALKAPLIGCTTEGFSYVHHSLQPFLSVTGFALPEGGRVEAWASASTSIPPIDYAAALASGSASFLILSHPAIGAGALRALHSRLSLLFPRGDVAAATAATVRRGSVSVPAEVVQVLPGRGDSTGVAGSTARESDAVVGLVLHGPQGRACSDTMQHIVASAWADVEFDDARGVLLSDAMARRLILPPSVAPPTSLSAVQLSQAAAPAPLPAIIPPTLLFMVDTVLFPNQTAIL